ncbi:MAG: DUF3244 domain-containing protein [Bacteroidaceae bacterium]|nr:DUF3244 domain-containing protein [Bacteroidaceae bacterium]
MNAKFLFTALLSMLTASTVLADPIELRIEKEGSTNHPRTGVPITASIESGIITTNVSTYSGTITVTIKDEDGDTVISTVENVSANSQFTTNVTSLADGTYTIYYTLGDTVYYGEFEKE